MGECSARLLAERGGDFAAAFKSQRRTARLVDSSRPGVSLHGAGAGAGAASVSSFPTPTFFFDLAELFDRDRFRVMPGLCVDLQRLQVRFRGVSINPAFKHEAAMSAFDQSR